jgi:pyruvate,water dikinase
VITEVGGILSHGAIVAREYGIPAVMSVTGATRLLQDGQRITVDGNKGLVYLDMEA